MEKINNITFEKESIEEIKVRQYIQKYIKELQRHFDMPNRKIRIILLKIYRELSPFNTIKLYSKKIFDMIKSNYKDIIKRK